MREERREKTREKKKRKGERKEKRKEKREERLGGKMTDGEKKKEKEKGKEKGGGRKKAKENLKTSGRRVVLQKPIRELKVTIISNNKIILYFIVNKTREEAYHKTIDIPHVYFCQRRKITPNEIPCYRKFLFGKINSTRTNPDQLRQKIVTC
jgi:hypothetical protein